MADLGRTWTFERDVEQAITALKKGAHLLNYSRKGKPRFCPFRLSNDEKTLMWLSGKEEMQLNLSSVVRIIPGQRTASFHRNPTPEKEYQSFSLIFGHHEQSLDLVCRDKDQAELWFVGLKALISGGRSQSHKLRIDTKTDGALSTMLSDGNSPIVLMRRRYNVGGSAMTLNSLQQEYANAHRSTYESPPHHESDKTNLVATTNSLDSKKGFPEITLIRESFNSTTSDLGPEAPKMQYKDSNAEAFRVSLSSVISSSSHGSGQDDVDALGDVYLWGEGLGEGLLGGGAYRAENGCGPKMDSLLPKHLESAVVLDVHNIACGRSHSALVNRQGEVFCWGEESGGRLGHGVHVDVAHPQLVESLANTCVEQVACGEYHTCAVTRNGDLYTWGDGTRSFGLLGQGNDFCHWMPKRVHMPEGVRVSSVACGPWHTALITSSGQLFTFGDGTFGTLGHGDNASVSFPKELESLKGLKTVKVACGAWHTAAVVEVIMGYSDSNVCPSGKLFTWGDAEKGRLGHGDKEQKNVPTCVAALVDYDFRQVACGHSLTVALTTSGAVFTMGSTVYGQLGDPQANGKYPLLVKSNLWEELVEEIACGSHHVAVLTSKTEVYTWGKGANGRLGHGDVQDRHTPTLVEALKEKQVKSIACGASFTAAVCLHKWLSGADQSICSGCRLSFGFTRKRHNCYNCGHVFCHACSSKKASKAILAPTPKKPYRVCDSCYTKLKNDTNVSSSSHIGLKKSSVIQQSLESRDRIKKDAKQLNMQLSLHSRLHDAERSRQYEEKSTSKFLKKPESLRRVSPAPSLFYETDSSSSYKYPISPISAPRRTISSVTSPVQRRSIPPHSSTSTPTFSGLGSPDFIFDELKKTNKSLTQEVLRLRAQVGSLTQHYQAQEAQLQHGTKELQMAIAISAEETSKCKAAKEVIRCLTMQLKDLAEKLPAQMHDNGGALTPYSPVSDGLCNTHAPTVTSETDDFSFRDQKHSGNLSVRIVQDAESNGAISSYAVPNGTFHFPQRAVSPQPGILRVSDGGGTENSVVGFHKYPSMLSISRSSDDTQILDMSVGTSSGRTSTHDSLEHYESGKKDADTPKRSTSLLASDMNSCVGTEWVKQHEPGVYITFTSLPSGGKDLKRVRFSRKKFSEKEAELWWAENRAQVYEQYNVRGLNNGA